MSTPGIDILCPSMGSFGRGACLEYSEGLPQDDICIGQIHQL